MPAAPGLTRRPQGGAASGTGARMLGSEQNPGEEGVQAWPRRRHFPCRESIDLSCCSGERQRLPPSDPCLLPRDLLQGQGGASWKRGVLEDGLSSNGVPRPTAPGGAPNLEKKMSCGTQCPNPQGLASGPLTQKQNGLRTTEAKRDAKRMSTKEVTINVTDSIRQVDRSRRITKNCVN
ncbi:brain and acute leukemia cytoplasmic protein [Suricata suricatta]|uniref:brain and acute leukemia cytoplasmic protein n=1 Tax=Suricata suricatta TaxID=37032 RepID=UPI001155EE4C|nr:brain and acute leukemia cytoplasmic protein [Suricata suricatta]